MSALSIRPLGANQTVLTVGNDEIFFSYQTPVAGFSSNDCTYFKTNKKFSRTTSKHITQYLDGRDAVELDQDKIESILD